MADHDPEPQEERGAPGSRGPEGGPGERGPVERDTDQAAPDADSGVNPQEPIDPESPQMPSGDQGG